MTKKPKRKARKPARPKPVSFRSPEAGFIPPGTSRRWVFNSKTGRMVLVYDRDITRPSESELDRRADVQRAKSREYRDFVEHAGTYQEYLAGGR